MSNLQGRFPRYSKLLALFPAAYRQVYSEQMLQTLADMLDNASPAERRKIWLRTSLDLPLSIVKQQLLYEGEIMSQHMPQSIKRNSMIGTALVLPFFVFLTLNGVLGQRLQHSVFWNTTVLFIWLIVFPTVALILNASALWQLVHSKHRENHVSRWKILADFRQNWPALVMVLVGAGILGLVFFHDSVGCVVGNPIREVTHWHATWQCIQQR